MASLVQELEQDAYDKGASLSNMLRKAKAVAVKLRLKQPMQFQLCNKVLATWLDALHQ